MGTCYLGERVDMRAAETAALARGVALGMGLLDTAEMYGDGAAELLIGDMLRSRSLRRADVTIVTKVCPCNASPPTLYKSCDASLARLGVDCIDLYLLHWRDGSVALPEMAGGMEELVSRGKIRRWGVSNFDVADMEELFRAPHGDRCAANQILYHLGSRGAEFDLLPWLAKHGVAAMAYCPLAQGGQMRRTTPDFLTEPTLRNLAGKYNVSIFQILLAFVLRSGNICAIPKAASIRHIEENASAPTLAAAISSEDWAALEAAYPPPSHKMHLDMD